ncbi:MAG TPA: ABC transporter ATP-binding protein [Gemmatimonadaceae bacterium]|nr:ABC transporter ATP-binding protein [Gemmatimonadaceae bacterium]
MTAPALRCTDLVRDFGKVRALDGLSLEVPRGIVFGFLGPNGAGKTTAIRTFLGLLAPSSGRADVLGFDVTRDAESIRERCGALLEHPGLYERLSAEENLEFHGRAWRLDRPTRRARIRELLDRAGLWDRRHEPVGHWSRGMKQKLAVSRAILHDPELVFLDEPTSGLDPVSTAALRDDLAALATRDGVTVFLTTHNLAEAERLCAQVGVVRRGRLVAVGAPAELRANVDGARVTVSGHGMDEALVQELRDRRLVASAELGPTGMLRARLPDDASAAALVAFLVERGVAVEEVRRERATFEETFLELIHDRHEAGEAIGGQHGSARAAEQRAGNAT